MKNRNDLNNGNKIKGRFGTFAGVFTPTVLTILGIILFLRVGWVVGQTGLIGALVIIFLANTISFITGLSLSSVATNMHVRTGGTYYMISRTLGLEIGGAIGIPLFLSQAISVAFYIIGFAEAFTAVFPGVNGQMISLVLALAFGYLSFVGADFILKIQFVILAVMGLALFSFFSGGWGEVSSPQLMKPALATAGFWSVFAIFFPAVTGIMVGVSMSGDLKDPGKSIPAGTLTAIILTGVIYLATAVWLGLHASPEQLVADNMIIHKIARWPLLILLGVWASTLSSALGSVLAAPRTLEAIATDRAVPKILGARLGSPTEPRLAVILTTAIAVIVILMGNLDFVAPIITMFFLNTYGMINLSAGLERLIGNPSFRPKFKVPWPVSLLGAAGCYGAMFLINAWATVVAVFISYGVFIVLKRRALTQGWGDIMSGVWFALARFGLIRLDAEPPHVKNWRPNIVVFTGLLQDREPLLEMGTWLTSGRGMVTYFHLLVGDLEDLAPRGLRATSARHTSEYLAEQGVAAFAECVIVRDFYEGILNIVQAHGIAGLESNIVLMGRAENPETQADQLRLMKHLMALGKSTLFLSRDPERSFGKRKRIDIWWRGKDRNAELMLLISHILRTHPDWERAEVRVIQRIARIEGKGGAEEHIAAFLKAVRMEAEPLVLVQTSPEESFAETLARESHETDLVFLGLRVPEDDRVEGMAAEIEALLPPGVSTLLFRSGEVEDILVTDAGQAP